MDDLDKYLCAVVLEPKDMPAELVNPELTCIEDAVTDNESDYYHKTADTIDLDYTKSARRFLEG